jgi:hypothetical protein
MAPERRLHVPAGPAAAPLFLSIRETHPATVILTGGAEIQ